VLIVADDAARDVEQYAVRVQKRGSSAARASTTAAPGRRKNDRRVKIEGATARGILLDAGGERIIDNDIVRAQEGDFYAASAPASIASCAWSKTRAAAADRQDHPQAQGFDAGWLIPLFILVLIGGGILRAIFAVSWARNHRHGRRRRRLGDRRLPPRRARDRFYRLPLRAPRRRELRGGRGGGGWSSAGSRRKLGGGGGFSGGGGSYGGGGASGSW